MYDALEFVKSNPISLFTDARTPLSLADRIKNQRTGDLEEALKTWKPWIPPKLSQGLQQGGSIIFEGSKVLYNRKDPATGDHVDLSLLLDIALKAKSG